jgi:hypothetical protein
MASTEGVFTMLKRKFSFSGKAIRLLVAGIAAVVIGGAAGIVGITSSSGSGTAAAATSLSATSGRHMPGGGGFNARSGPAAGGSSGTVDSVSGLAFTLTTSAGQKVTVKEASTTTYQKGTSSTSASAIKNGERVLVLGTTYGTTITASQVTVKPAGSGPTSSSTAGVVPFRRGAQSTSKQVGQIPANYSQGSGTILGGTAANNATEAALAAYPGGIVDRVVKLSNGEYEVHNIGVTWPHHIFVSRDFKVLGAD